MTSSCLFQINIIVAINTLIIRDLIYLSHTQAYAWPSGAHSGKLFTSSYKFIYFFLTVITLLNKTKTKLRGL
jgi:hypothetical protein